MPSRAQPTDIAKALAHQDAKAIKVEKLIDLVGIDHLIVAAYWEHAQLLEAILLGPGPPRATWQRKQAATRATRVSPAILWLFGAGQL